jgi:hypothetical protein
MSLQLAAQHLSSHGRGNDSTLVHMSPREVKSLNDIAMAHGGQLSINPNTGLPEAGFLESILPMVAGAGLTADSGVWRSLWVRRQWLAAACLWHDWQLAKRFDGWLGCLWRCRFRCRFGYAGGVELPPRQPPPTLQALGHLLNSQSLHNTKWLKQAALAAPIVGPTAQLLADLRAFAGAEKRNTSGAQFQAAFKTQALAARKQQLCNLPTGLMGDRFGA